MGIDLEPFRSGKADEANPGGLVFSTNQIMSDELPLLLVTHDEDGDWQFVHGSETDDLANAALMHVEHVLERYPEIAELADLPPGWIATRSEPGERWQRMRRPADWDG